MRLHVIACGVFEPYLKILSGRLPHQISITVLDAGLHAQPNDLRLQAQEEIDRASAGGDIDACILLYGLCGRGTAGIASRQIPVVIPKAHDCITLFLGSGEAYLKQFSKNPGTFYHTLGWIDKKINPKNREASRIYRNFAETGYDRHPEFASLKAKYGQENAEHILAFFDRWKQHYSRAAYIDMGFPEELEYVDFTRAMAETFGWQHEVIQGDTDFLVSLLEGRWDESRVLIMPPGHVSVSTGDDRVLACAPVDAEVDKDEFSNTEVILQSGDGAGKAEGIGLGIDAGGTYTDAVIFDLGKREVLAKSKALTTYHNLVEGISNALNGLPPRLLKRVQVTSLSTTLATNFIVEGKGHKVGLIALTPWWDDSRAKIGHEPAVRVPGYVGIEGNILEELDEQACREAIQMLAEQEACAVIVVAGNATIRNPQQAMRVREIALEVTDVPVVCDFEVSRRLNWINRSQTAIANARLIPVISGLIEAVREVLSNFQVSGKLMVVKGDGTPEDESVARGRPVETILSGPAASVSGARILTGLDDALVLDIGGTTTDCAIIENGHVAVSPEGARIGGWTMSVDAVEITTDGLGGDSRVSFNRDRQITVGPTRNIPVCYLASEYSSVKLYYRNLNSLRFVNAPDSSPLDILVFSAPVELDFTEREKRLVDLLQQGPMPAIRAAESLGLASPVLLPLSRLEACGMIKRSALTPTDLLHASGRFVRWDKEAAELALECFAKMYGKSPQSTLEDALRMVSRSLFNQIIRREVSYENRGLTELPENWAFLLDKAYQDEGLGLGVKITLRRPVVAIGAPAAELVPEVADHLGCEIVVPEHSDVANAVGAIGSEIVIREEVLIQPGNSSNYVLHATDRRMEFSSLEKATESALEIARLRALERAAQAGAQSAQVTVIRSDRSGNVSFGGQVLLERRVIATASGAAFSKRAIHPES